MQNLNQRLKNALSLGVLIILLFTSCTNDPASIGIDILPTSDVLEAAADSQQVTAYNTFPDRILSDGFSPGAAGILGYFNDPRLGVTKADIVAEINVKTGFDSLGLDLDGLNYFPDSVVLNLYYTNKSWFGKDDSKFRIQVYELTERLGSDVPYYNNESMTGRYNPILLGEKLVSPDGGKNDSVWNVDKSDTIRIKLSTDPSNPLDIANRLFNVRNISTEDKSHRDKIKDIVNGLYITVDGQPVPAGEGALLKIDMLNSLTNVTLHYRKEVYDLTNDQVLRVTKQEYVFPISTEGRVFNRFEHTPPSGMVIDDPSTSKIYLQGMAGSFAKIDLSSLFEQWKNAKDEARDNDYNLGFSGVDLLFYADTDTTTSVGTIEKSLYVPMSRQIMLVVKNEKGVFEQPTFKKDGREYAAFSNSGVATLNEKENSFKFSMQKEYFEQILEMNTNEEPYPHFYLRLPNTPFNFNRVTLYNQDEDNKGIYPKVKVKYVKF